MPTPDSKEQFVLGNGRKLSRAQVVHIARHIVEHWESIEDRHYAFQARHGISDELRDHMMADTRRLAGGEELYLACKDLLAEGSK